MSIRSGQPGVVIERVLTPLADMSLEPCRRIGRRPPMLEKLPGSVVEPVDGGYWEFCRRWFRRHAITDARGIRHRAFGPFAVR